MKTYVSTILFNQFHSKAHVEIVDAETLHPVDSFEVALVSQYTIITVLKEWAEKQPVRPLRIVNFAYHATCTLVQLN